MLPRFVFDAESETPIYRQLGDRIRGLIEAGELRAGDRLPATRELATHLALNRTTVSAAYDLLESEGRIRRHVGRGSFVAGGEPQASEAGIVWEQVLSPIEPPAPPPPSGIEISFSASRPSEDLFPLDEFRQTCEEATDGIHTAGILQLGYPGGYPPLRAHLLDGAMREGTASDRDDIGITSGCQQAVDLMQRVLAPAGETVIIEDPVYAGVKNVFTRAGVNVVGVPVGKQGVDPGAFERALAEHRPRLALLTPNFQNPTGATLPLDARHAILEAAREHRVVLVENDIYGELRYWGERLPTLKQLDESGIVVQLRSFSKIAFPGLRVGWITGPRPLIARIADAKQWCDLHTDQLSQAILLRFAQSGRLGRHRERMRTMGLERLRATLRACEHYLPEGATFTRPEGGMNVWVTLPEPLDAFEWLSAAQRRGVTYLPGRYFAVSRPHAGSLRLSFAGLAPERIDQGIRILGAVFRDAWERTQARLRMEPAPAMV